MKLPDGFRSMDEYNFAGPKLDKFGPPVRLLLRKAWDKDIPSREVDAIWAKSENKYGGESWAFLIKGGGFVGFYSPLGWKLINENENTSYSYTESKRGPEPGNANTKQTALNPTA